MMKYSEMNWSNVRKQETNDIWSDLFFINIMQ